MPAKQQRHTIGLLGVRDNKNVLYSNVSYVVRTLEQHIARDRRTIDQVGIVTGGGRGVEEMVVNWCEAKSVECRKIPPNIAEFGARKAFFIRNNHVVSQSDEVIIFWDGCIDVMREAIMTAAQLGKVTTVYPVLD